MEITTRLAGDATIVDVTGDIDLYNSTEVRKVLLALLREKRLPRVVVNMKAVNYIDSSGVASLVEGLKASRDLSSRLILFGLSPAARGVLELTRLIRIFEVYDDEDEALRASQESS